MISVLVALALAQGPDRTDLGPAREPGLLPGGVQSMAVGPDGALWFARCREGLSKLDPLEGRRRTWTVADGVPVGCVTEVAPTPDGAWAITPDRAFQLKDGAIVRVLPLDPDGDATVSAIALGPGGEVWLGGQGGRLLGLRADGVEVRWQGGDLAALGTISAIRVGPDGRLHVSSRDRVTTLDPQSGSFDFRVAHGEDPGLPPGRPGPVVFAPDGAWAVVRAERVDDPRGSVVQLLPSGYRRLDLPGLSDRPLRLEGGPDGTLWISDDAGVVAVSPDRNSARRVGVRRGFVPGGPWAIPAGDGTAWAAWEATTNGVALHRVRNDGSVVLRLAPQAAPAAGSLVRTDEGVLLSTADGLFSLDPATTLWSPHPGFGDLDGSQLRRISRVHRGPGGRTWVAGPDGLRVGYPEGGWEDADPPEGGGVLDVYEAEDGTTWVAAEGGLFVRDRAGSWAKVVDDAQRPVAGVKALVPTPAALWAWGPGGAWTVTGSDAVRQLAGPVLDLVAEGETVWTVRNDGVRRTWRGESTKEALPPILVDPQQIVVRRGQVAQVRAGDGLWRLDPDGWHRVLGGTGPFIAAGGWLWRWDADGLHTLPPGGEAWRWIGLGPPKTSATPIGGDQVAVLALDGVLAVEVDGVVVGDPRRQDPIVDIDVRGTRWAALSRQGVLLRGDAYRVLERTFVPGPSRRVALGPRSVCVAGASVWCRRDERWKLVFGVPDLPAPLPLVDLAVDHVGRVHVIQPGAWCREGLGCRRLKGPEQTSLAVSGGVAWIGGLQGLIRIGEDGAVAQVANLAGVDVAAGADGVVWVATGAGLVPWTPAGPGEAIPGVFQEVVALQTGALVARSGSRRWLIPESTSLPTPATP